MPSCTSPSRRPQRILPLLSQVADVLATLHANGVVHRDLKPDNVMVRRGRQGEEAILIDFGIALLDADNDALKRYGTAGYIAPEQAQGEKVDGRADIYSLGRMLAEIWVGDGRNGAVPKPLAANRRANASGQSGEAPRARHRQSRARVLRQDAARAEPCRPRRLKAAALSTRRPRGRRPASPNHRHTARSRPAR